VKEKIVLLLSQRGEAQNVYFRARFKEGESPGLWGSVNCMCVCVACTCDTAECHPSISLTHASARRLKVCDGFGVLGSSHPLLRLGPGSANQRTELPPKRRHAIFFIFPDIGVCEV